MLSEGITKPSQELGEGADGHWLSVVRKTPIPGQAGRSPQRAAGPSASILQMPIERLYSLSSV